MENHIKDKENWDKEISEIVKDIDKQKEEEKKAKEQLNKAKYRQIMLKITELDILLITTSEMNVNDDDKNTIKHQIELDKDEAKAMKSKYDYLDECDYENWSPERIKTKFTEMKTEAEKIEKEIDELSKNEDYEAAEEKQNKLVRLTESIKKLEEVMGQRFPQVPIAVEEEKKVENIETEISDKKNEENNEESAKVIEENEIIDNKKEGDGEESNNENPKTPQELQ